MIQPAKRLQQVEEYYFSKKLKQIDAMRAQGLDVINLGIGNPDFPPSAEVTDALSQESSKPNVHGYQSYIGIPELRKAMTDWYQKYFRVTVNPTTEILPLTGSKEGIMHISMAYVNEGDEVLVPNPGYPTYTSVSNLVGAKIRSYDLKEELGWFPDLEEIERQGVEKVKIMWINYPHMPTGAPASMDFFKKVIAFGKKHNILIVNDNPYSFILNDNPISLLEVEGAKDIAIELNSLSKSHNMAGWRIGMAISSPEIIQNILRVKSNMDSGMFRPLQVAATKALSFGDDWFKSVNDEYRRRRVWVWQIFDALGCEYSKNQNGMFVWSKIPANISSVEELSDNILEQTNVFITPGFIFGDNGKRFLRISLCTREELLEQALERIKKMK